MPLPLSPRSPVSATPSPAHERPDDELQPQDIRRDLQPQSRDDDRRHAKVISADDTLVPLQHGDTRGDPLAAK